MRVKSNRRSHRALKIKTDKMRYKEGEKERYRYQQKYIMSGEQIGLKVRKNQKDRTKEG